MAYQTIPPSGTGDGIVYKADPTEASAMDVTAMDDGALVWVASYQTWFGLETRTLTADGRTVLATPTAGRFLKRLDGISGAFWQQTPWEINPSTGSDLNTGAAGSPLATFDEFFRRILSRQLPPALTQSITVNLTGNTAFPDTDYIGWGAWSKIRSAAVNITINGQQTQVASRGGVVSGAIAPNRATGQANTVTTPDPLTVGRMVRLTGTTTNVAWVTKDLGSNTYELSEHSVAGALSTGYVNGNVLEEVTGTKVGGVHVSAGLTNLILNDIDFDPAAAVGIRLDSGSISMTRCRFRGSTSGQIRAFAVTATASAFVDRAYTVQGLAGFTLCSSINMASSGIAIFAAPTAENSFTSHTAQASTVTIGENGYVHISGGGSTTYWCRDLAAGQKGFALLNAATLSLTGMCGAGNNATSIAVDLPHTASFACSAAVPATSLSMTGSVGLRLTTATATIDVPLAQLPHTIGGGVQPGSSSFVTGKLTSGGGAVFTYCATSDAPTANQATRWAPVTSEKLALRLRVKVRSGAIGVNAPVTLYKNGSATAMTVTIVAGAAVGTEYVDSSHPIIFVDDDDWDVRGDAPVDVVTPGDLVFSGQVEWAA